MRREEPSQWRETLYGEGGRMSSRMSRGRSREPRSGGRPTGGERPEAAGFRSPGPCAPGAVADETICDLPHRTQWPRRLEREGMDHLNLRNAAGERPITLRNTLEK